MPVLFLSLCFSPHLLFSLAVRLNCNVLHNVPRSLNVRKFSRPGRGSHCHRRKCCHFILKIVFLAYRTTTAMMKKIGRGGKVEQVVWQVCDTRILCLDWLLIFCSSISVVKWYWFIMWCMQWCLCVCCWITGQRLSYHHPTHTAVVCFTDPLHCLWCAVFV